MKPTLYALFLSATLGADDFATRQRWHKTLEALPWACLPGCYHDDAEVRDRCRRITGYAPPAWTESPEHWDALLLLMLGTEAEINRHIDDGQDEWTSERISRVCRLENLAKDIGLLTNGRVLNYYPGTWDSVVEMRRRVLGLDPIVPAPRPVIPLLPVPFGLPIPQPLP
jgi:hypothetical protein